MLDYLVKQVPNSFANRFQKRNHYLHRTAVTTFSFALYNDNGLGYPIGICIFGNPGTPSIPISIAGKEEKDRVLELNRLWVKDGTPPNTESWFVSRCLKLLRKLTDRDIIIAYADSAYGHIGTIYQALSFIYTGLTPTAVDYFIEGIGHSRSVMKKGNAKELQQKYGKKLKRVRRSRKHRYVFFNTGIKKRKKMLLSKLCLSIENYPKVIK